MKSTFPESQKTLCIGAGPAGLTAAYELARSGHEVVILEAHPTDVGGIARTHKHHGFRFDIGGHRFFSKSAEIENLWTELLPDDFIVRDRSSQIYYNKNFYPYPLKAFETLKNLGLLETVRCIGSYLLVRLGPFKNPANFREWMTNRFGSRLFSIFFKTYTEKVWGRSCDEISTEWAEQRVQSFSLLEAVTNALTPSFIKRESSKTLLSTFRYPRLGPGMLWESTADKIRALGGEVRLNSRVTGILKEQNHWLVEYIESGARKTAKFSHVISSMPLTDLNRILSPKLPASLGLETLEYRDFILVALMTKSPDTFADQWLYIHDKDVRACRLQNFKSWSPEMVPSAEFNCYGLEYFCSEGDELWNMTDEELIALAKKESAHISLFAADSVVDACVIRQKKAYPIYSGDYQRRLDLLQKEIDQNYSGLFVVGRNGMHRYNNQDHAMMTGLLTARNIMAKKSQFDPWKVNQDAEYLESGFIPTTPLHAEYEKN